MDMDIDQPTAMAPVNPKPVFKSRLSDKTKYPDRPCITCRSPLSYFERFKNCLACRKKNREKEQAAKVRKEKRKAAENEWMRAKMFALEQERRTLVAAIKAQERVKQERQEMATASAMAKENTAVVGQKRKSDVYAKPRPKLKTTGDVEEHLPVKKLKTVSTLSVLDINGLELMDVDDIPSPVDFEPTPVVKAENFKPMAGGSAKLKVKGEPISKSLKAKSKMEPAGTGNAKTLAELEGKEKKRAIREMKTMLKRMTIARSSTYSAETKEEVVDSHSVEGETITEHQTASALYSALKARQVKSAATRSGSSSVPTKKLKFKGTHSIVQVDRIDKKKRLEMVVRDVRKMCRVGFESLPTCAAESPYEHYAVYACTCSQPPATALSSQTSVASIGGSSSQHSSQPGSSQATAFQSQKIGSRCGGQIIISVLDDHSQSGLRGQKIIVRVRHSGSSV